SKFGLLGSGDANAGVAAYLADRGVGVTAWALPDHHGALPLSRQDRSHHATYHNVLINTYPLKEAASLKELVESNELLILAAPADARELYVAALEELNHLLQDTILLVIDGKESTLLYSGRLKVKYVLESCLFHTAPRLADDESALNAKDTTEELELSRSPFYHKGPDNP